MYAFFVTRCVTVYYGRCSEVVKTSIRVFSLRSVYREHRSCAYLCLVYTRHDFTIGITFAPTQDRTLTLRRSRFSSGNTTAGGYKFSNTKYVPTACCRYRHRHRILRTYSMTYRYRQGIPEIGNPPAPPCPPQAQSGEGLSTVSFDRRRVAVFS